MSKNSAAGVAKWVGGWYAGEVAIDTVNKTHGEGTVENIGKALVSYGSDAVIYTSKMMGEATNEMSHSWCDTDTITQSQVDNCIIF